MTQTLIKQLEALPRYSTASGDVVLDADISAIIEQAKAEKLEAVAIVDKSIPSCEIQYTDAVDSNGLPDGTLLYTTKKPDIVAELLKALGDDAYAASFQSMWGYRTALIAKVKGII